MYVHQHDEGVAIEAVDLARQIASTASDELASDIVVLDIQPLSTIADYFVIASVDSVRQLRSLAESIELDLKENHDTRPTRREGPPDSGWVVIDYNAVLVHILTVELRDFYRLEELWSDANRVLMIQ